MMIAHNNGETGGDYVGRDARKFIRDVKFA
jgi:hypothetical protein